jgi:hypothetical protein
LSNGCKNKKGVKNISRLVKKAQKGDNKAFLKLFQYYEEDIYRKMDSLMIFGKNITRKI